MTVLSEQEQKSVNSQKVELRLSIEAYLRSHPELPAMIQAFTKRVVLDKPEDTRAYAAKFFTSPDLQQQVQLTNHKY
jgi:hypothetical protein